MLFMKDCIDPESRGQKSRSFLPYKVFPYLQYTHYSFRPIIFRYAILVVDERINPIEYGARYTGVFIYVGKEKKEEI